MKEAIYQGTLEQVLSDIRKLETTRVIHEIKIVREENIYEAVVVYENKILGRKYN